LRNKNGFDDFYSETKRKAEVMKKYLGLLICATLTILLSCGPDVKIVMVEPANFKFTKITQSQKLEVKAQDMRGGDIPDIKFTFRSEDTSVATVDSNGLVKPVGNGSTAIIAKAAVEGTIEGEGFVKICLPKALICEPSDKLALKVGTAGPIKCHVTDCKDEEISAKIDLVPATAEPKMLLKEGENIFIGLAVGDTTVKVTAYDMEQTIKVHIDEQVYLPGMGPDTGGSAPARRPGSKDGADPYGGSGRFDHILKNM
jgi:Bacterial Ig-like domain (group 2)